MAGKRVVLAGHRLIKLYSYDSVSRKTAAECACGWHGSFRSHTRGREAYREHLLQKKARGGARLLLQA